MLVNIMSDENSVDYENPTNPHFITAKFCNERFLRITEMIEDKFTTLSDKMDSCTDNFNSYMKEIKNENKKKRRDWRELIFSISGAVAGGIIITLVLHAFGV